MTTYKRILRNGFAALFQKSVKVAEQLLLIPFFIQFWGAAYYGEWLTLTVIPSFLALSDFGFGSAAANSFLLKIAAGDKQGAANTARTGLRVISYIIGLATLLSLLILFILKKLHLFDKSQIPAEDATTAVFLLLLARIVSFYQQLFEAHFRAARRASLSINLISMYSFSNILGGLIVLLTGGRIVEYAIVNLGIALLFNPIYIYVASCVFNLHKQYRGEFLHTEMRVLIKKGFGYFLAPIWQAVYFQGSTFVVRIVLGPVAVTIFNTVRTLVRSSSQAFAMIIVACYPDFQFELGSGNLMKAKQIFFGALSINLLLALSCVICLGLFGSSLYMLWTHKSLIVATSVWIIFISSIVFYSLWFTFSFIFEALNKPFAYTSASLLFAIVSGAITWLLSLQIGLTGAALGNLSFDLLMCLYLVPAASKLLNTTLSEVLINLKMMFGNMLTKLKVFTFKFSTKHY